MSTQFKQSYEFGPFRLDAENRLLLRDRQPVPLTPKAFDSLLLLVERSGRLVLKDELMNALWPDTFVDESNLTQTVFMLRKALGETGTDQRYITTVPGRGYRFTADVRQVSADTEPLRRSLPVPIVTVTGTLAVLAIVAWLWWFGFLKRGKAGTGTAPEYVQLTDYTDSADSPALSRDGRMLAFVRRGAFGSYRYANQIYVKMLPNGEPVQLTNDDFRKGWPTFSPDGSRVIYTIFEKGYEWNSWQVPSLGGVPQPFMANASGLVWIDDKQVMYSEIKRGLYMGVVASTEDWAGHRDIYLPKGEWSMAHRSAGSPDGKWVLIAEMNYGVWLPCRVVPFDGSSEGRRMGPQKGGCTTAAWSPDGHWMYFMSDADGKAHVWRQRFPAGDPEQITFGPTDESDIAVTPDGKYIITSIGAGQANIWYHDNAADRQVTWQGNLTRPTLAPSGDKIYYLAGSELWVLDPRTGAKARVFASHLISDYCISPDGRKILFTSTGNEAGDGVWIADQDRRGPPRRLTHGGKDRAFFGKPGEIIYMSAGEVGHLYRMEEDGTGNELVEDDPIIRLEAVSPDGKWAVVRASKAPDDNSVVVKLFSTSRKSPFLVCDTCMWGPGAITAPILSWSANGKDLFVSLQYFGLHSQRTAVLPYRSDWPPEKFWPQGLKSEKDLATFPGARMINEPDVFPGPDISRYLFWKGTGQRNLYRIPIPQ